MDVQGVAIRLLSSTADRREKLKLQRSKANANAGVWMLPGAAMHSQKHRILPRRRPCHGTALSSYDGARRDRRGS